ncbi:phosphocarrier protein FPr [Chelatococcus caeni]|uniref:Phosphoenolpyruvate-protein phosphotransferase n=1 Tax=Chelatococcus caeni TaxID=1348468 RepID=A0A840C2H2_9HYPH|nr:phosphoenolpyruvate--protein phosphotransferase [Chelatococcus caeni]MBB4019370.1 phosphocarrier protein FPr [Chelatococcus caeni]
MAGQATVEQVMDVERTAVVRLEEGLHARPAARVVQFAKGFSSDIEIVKGGRSANAKSTVKLMLLAVKEGDEIVIRARGEDAEAAVEGLAAIVAGEADDPAREAAQTVPPEHVPAPTVAQEPAAPGELVGVAASEGVAVGRAFVYLPREPQPERGRIAAQEVEAETLRFRRAVETVCAMLERKADNGDAAAATAADIMAALKDVAQDPEFLTAVEARIGAQEDPVAAVLAVGADLAERFTHIDDAYFRARAEDVRGVARQVANVLLGRDEIDLAALAEPAILVAGHLSALDLARLPLRLLEGLVTTEGGPTSHIAILARSFGFPAVVGVKAEEAALRSAQTVAIDGGRGVAVVNPDTAVAAAYAARLEKAKAERRALAAFTHVAPKTHDGRAIEVAANLGSEAEIDGALGFGAMGVGLFRTEFLFMHGKTLPSEDEQFRIYARVVKAFDPHAVIFRTLDIGGDKALPGIAPEREENPFLGWRGIRMCLDRPHLLKPQLRAILRAAAVGTARVMFPMVTDIAEVTAARALIEACRQELMDEGREAGPLEVGIMVETPAAALCAATLAREVDFFSIGTNDLTQYTMAADRTNARLAHLNRADHPAVLAMIEMTCRAAREAGIKVGVCGEAAGEPDMIPRLLGWGVSELSMSPSLIPRAKKIVSET